MCRRWARCRSGSLCLCTLALALEAPKVGPSSSNRTRAQVGLLLLWWVPLVVALHAAALRLGWGLCSVSSLGQD